MSEKFESAGVWVVVSCVGQRSLWACCGGGSERTRTGTTRSSAALCLASHSPQTPRGHPSRPRSLSLSYFLEINKTWITNLKSHVKISTERLIPMIGYGLGRAPTENSSLISIHQKPRWLTTKRMTQLGKNACHLVMETPLNCLQP